MNVQFSQASKTLLLTAGIFGYLGTASPVFALGAVTYAMGPVTANYVERPANSLLPLASVKGAAESPSEVMVAPEAKQSPLSYLQAQCLNSVKAQIFIGLGR